MRKSKCNDIADNVCYCLKFYVPMWIVVAVCVWALS